MQIYLVGGAVRDALLGLEVVEQDWVVVGSSAEELRGLGYSQVGKDFPVFLHPQSHEEYALARTERKTGPGHKGFSVDANVDVSLEEDLLRRDLSINALARDEHGELVDPYGGLDDLKARVLRHVSEAFSEDPLRVFRVARFYARFSELGFSIADKTQKLLSEMCASGALQQVSAERVWQELHKTLGRSGAENFFSVLQNCGGLQGWFSELEAVDLAKLGHDWNQVDKAFSDMPEHGTGDVKLQWQKYVALGLHLKPDQSLALSVRLKVPKKYQRGMLHIAEYGAVLNVWQTLSDEELLEVVGFMGALKQSSDFEALLDIIGICGGSDPARLVELSRALNRIGVADVQELEKQPGARLGEAIRGARLEYIHNHR